MVDLDECRPLMRHGLRQRRLQLADLGDPDTVAAAKAGELREVRIAQIGLPDLPLTRPLLLRDLAQLVVVQQHMGDVHVVLDGRGELHGVLTEAAIAGDGDHLAAT